MSTTKKPTTPEPVFEPVPVDAIPKIARTTKRGPSAETLALREKLEPVLTSGQAVRFAQRFASEDDARKFAATTKRKLTIPTRVRLAHDGEEWTVYLLPK